MWEGKVLWFFAYKSPPPPPPTQILLVNQVMFALFLSGSMQNAMLLQVEERRRRRVCRKQEWVENASEIKASLWQGSQNPSRMPWGCGMSLWPVTLADMHGLTSWAVCQRTVKGNLSACVQPGGAGGLCGQQLPSQKPTDSPFQLMFLQSLGCLPLAWSAGVNPGEAVCCCMFSVHKAFNCCCTHPLRHVAASHKEIAQVDHRSKMQLWETGSQHRHRGHRYLSPGESKFPLSLGVLEFSCECAMIRVVLHMDSCLRNALTCSPDCGPKLFCAQCLNPNLAAETVPKMCKIPYSEV